LRTEVEERPVFVGALLVQAGGVGVAHGRELISPCLHQVEEVPVALFGLLPRGVVVGAESRFGVVDEPRMLAEEEIELTVDDFREATTHGA
jgi:hypothetical protein